MRINSAGHWRRAIAALAMVFVVAPVSAQMTVTVTPARDTVSVNADQVVHLLWDVQSPASPAAGLQAQSGQGLLRDALSGQIVLTIGRALATTLPGRVREDLQISREVIVRALNLGTGQLIYEREWRGSDGQRQRSSMKIAIVGSQATGLQIRNLRVEFPGGQTELFQVARDSVFAATAVINYQGREGTLEYEWQLSQPGSTRESPHIATLFRGQRSLRGGGLLRLESPPLPSYIMGPYVLRFVILRPQTVVTEAAYIVGSPAAVIGVDLYSPQPGQSMRLNDLFRWQAIPHASSYQLELMENGKRVAGVLLSGDGLDQPSAGITNVMQERLQRGCDCEWQVLAFGADGQIIARSQPRAVVLRMP